MVDVHGRVLDPLASRRRHLTLLVGLLSLTFVLTAVLTYQGRRAESEVRQLARERLRNAAAHAAEAWSFTFQYFLGQELERIARRVESRLVHTPDRALARLLYENQDGSGDAMIRFADEAGVENRAAFAACLNDSSPVPAIEADITAAESVGGGGTPTVIVNNVLLGGRRDSLSLAAIIQETLR
jgi:predicted DsbA family dithiol-disulfide isomerase